MVTPDIIWLLAASAATSASICVTVVLTGHWHGRYSFDSQLDGKQKMHKDPVPRIGGIGVLIALCVAAILMLTTSAAGGSDESAMSLKLLAAALPVFAAGLAEDITKTVSPRMRLLAAAASASLGGWLLGAWLERVDIWGVDLLLQFAPAAVMLTLVAVSGVVNGVNVVDGFHGLAGSITSAILLGLAAVNWMAGDMVLVHMALGALGATLGFLLVNYPCGRIFLGDGGAYLIGFFIAEIAVLTVTRHPNISAWQILAICVWPVLEMLFSIYRRKLRRASPLLPDRLHLHTLIYRRIVCRHLARRTEREWIRNSAVAPMMALPVAFSIALAVWLGATTAVALAVLAATVLGYLLAYRRLSRRLLGKIRTPVPREEAAAIAPAARAPAARVPRAAHGPASGTGFPPERTPANGYLKPGLEAGHIRIYTPRKRARPPAEMLAMHSNAKNQRASSQAATRH